MRTVRATLTVISAALAVAGALAPPLVDAGGRRGVDDAAIVLVVATYAVVGAVIELARHGHPVGRLMLAGAVAWGVGEGLIAVAVDTALETGVLLGVVGTALRGVGWLLLVVALPLFFPDGRPPRYAVRLAVACISLLVLGSQSYLPYDHLLDAHRAALGDLLTVVTVDGGHSVLWDALDETAEAIQAFLESAPTS